MPNVMALSVPICIICSPCHFMDVSNGMLIRGGMFRDETTNICLPCASCGLLLFILFLTSVILKLLTANNSVAREEKESKYHFSIWKMHVKFSVTIRSQALRGSGC